MGNEAQCECEWNGSRHAVKALLEPPELILRGTLRRRFPFAALKNVRADHDSLRFVFEGENFALALGNTLAPKWVRTMTSPPPTLAKKLGISPAAAVRIIGSLDDSTLESALAEARIVTGSSPELIPDLIVARVNTPAEVRRVLQDAAKDLRGRVPIWFVYPKGKGHAVSENDVRATALAAGIVDTKVCAVSPALTALRFVRRRDP